jgi:hypothetical protein
VRQSLLCKDVNTEAEEATLLSRYQVTTGEGIED